MENKIYLFGEFIGQDGYRVEANIAQIIGQSKAKAGELSQYPLAQILEILDRVGRRWADPGYSYRRLALESLQNVQGMSTPAANAALDIIPQLLQFQSLQRRLAMSLPFSLEVLDRWLRPIAFPGRLRALPCGCVVHICAGNVFLGALDSLIMGLITKNANILKLASQDPGTILHFVQSLLAEDQEGVVAKSLAILKWERGNPKIEEVVLQKADAILVWGGDEAIRHYRTAASPYVRVMGYGPKISFGIVGTTSFDESQFADIAARYAHDLCLYDQKACSSPQNLFIPSQDQQQLAKFAQILGEALQAEMKKTPPTPMEPNELVEVNTQRLVTKFKAGQHQALLTASANNSGYTVVYNPENPKLQTSPLNRFIYLKSYRCLPDFTEILQGFGEYLQSAGIYAQPDEWAEWEKILTQLGVSRLAPAGEMLDVHDGAPHDGTLPLLELLRWVSSESPSALPQSREYMRQFLIYVQSHTPFYQKHWQGVDLTAPDFFDKLPLLTKELFLQNSPPDSQELVAQTAHHPIIFSSGGSTGNPKFSYFTHDEFDLIASRLADQYLGLGLVPSDKAANLFVAGHLWSSFLVIDRAVNKIGITNLPIGGHSDYAEMCQYLRTFQPNVLFGIPATLNGLLHYTLENNILLRIQKIFYAGEFMTEAMVRNFKNNWGVQQLHSAGYASVDAGLIGYQCPAQTGGYHHLFADMLLMELLDEDGKIVNKNGDEGEIVITALYRKMMPFVRYRTGDLGVYIAKPCPCGRNDRVFQLLGRCDDRLQIGGSRIFIKEIEKLLLEYEFLTGAYQFIPQLKDGEEFLEIWIETTNRKKCTKKFVAGFTKKFYEIFSDLRDSVAQKWLVAPQMQFVPPDTIPQVVRTGKVKRILDRRKS